MAGIANTTAPPPSDGPSPDGDVRHWVRAAQNRRQARILALPAGLAALSLIILAAPRFAGEAVVWPARAAILDIQTGGDAPDPETLADAASLLEKAGGWTGDARLVTDAGLLLMRRAEAATDPDTRRDLLLRAVAATENGLRRAPAHPVAWTRLAAMRMALGQPDSAAAAMRMSLLTGPLVPQITASRLAQGLAMLSHLDTDTRGLLARQVRLLATAQPERLRVLQAGDRAADDFIRWALAGA